MSIKKIIEQIIPPSNYHHRNGFNNIPLIDKLSNDEKTELEDALIHRLLFDSEEEIDTLIVETLAYLKSQKALPVLKNILEKSSESMTKLIISTSIFEINGDSDMVDIAITSFRKLDDNKNPYYVYILPSAFYYLIKFRSTIVNSIIEEYVNHKDYLIAYNAKQALGRK
jgi:hypothetical protein